MSLVLRRLLRPRAAHVALLGAGVALVTSCHEPLDTERIGGKSATLGDDIFGLVCDRLGADVLQEDLTGASYDSICHYDGNGNYGDEVNQKLLPKTTAKEARRLSVAKMEALARRRAELVQAFNATFPDIDIDDPSTSTQGDTVAFHDALMELSQNVAELYDSNPYETLVGNPEPLAPASTRALGRLFASMQSSDEARAVFSQMWGRRGYRPSGVGLGAIRSALEYPSLRELTASSANLLGPNGQASPELKQMLSVGEQSLLWMKPEISTLPDLSPNPFTASLNRPRTTLEIFRDLMLSEDPRYAPSTGEEERYIALRDKRGYVIPEATAGGFVDLDSDGLADVDAFGRFLDGGGAPLTVDPPFTIPGVEPFGPSDAFGRPSGGVYRYVDTSRTPGAALGSMLTPLLDATAYADPADPYGFEQEYETLMYAIGGAQVLFGPREEVEYDFENDEVVPLGTGCKACVKYSRFRGDESPFTALAHATGQILADEDSDALLLGLIDLAENHEPELARLIAAAVRVKEIANAHDEQAAAGELPPAGLPYENPIWDQAAQALATISDEPRLVTGLLAALADPAVVTPTDGSDHLGETIALFASTVDEMQYDQNDINGPARNLTEGGFSTSDPQNAVDWNAPRNGRNRSILERSLLLIHDTAGAKSCNKDGAVVSTPFGVEWPLVGSYGPCELFEISNLAAFYFGALVYPTHPKRTEFVLKDGALLELMNLISFINTPDEMMQESSGLTGMTLHPTPQALNRLVYFGASSDAFPNMPDHDFINEGGTTDTFIYGLMDPIPTAVCPLDSLGIGNCVQNDLLRLRTTNSIFAWERRGFYQYLGPVVTPFVNVSCDETVSFCDTTDYRGEKMFLDLTNVFYAHYPGPDHGNECENAGTFETNPRYCSEAGLNAYEPIIDKAMRTDLIPALHEFAVAAHQVSQITVLRGPKAGQTLTGSQVLELTTRILLSQKHAAQSQITDFYGDKTTTWTDGTPQSQLTPFNLFADGLHGIDVAFDAAEDGDVRRAQWKRARSQLVDELLATEGVGQNTRFRHRALVPLLVTTLKLVREQTNAHCPDRENGGGCTWGRQEIGRSVADALSSPAFAAMMDLAEALRNDPNARRSLERFLTYMLENAGSGETLQGTLASMVDVMQVMADDGKMVPILRSASVAMRPHDHPKGGGVADNTLRMMKALSSDDYDRYHALDLMLRNLVTPMQGEGGAPGLSPLEVIMDVAAEVNREDSSLGAEPLSPQDYGYIFKVMNEFMSSESRGLEQLYSIVARRQKQ